ncbi:anti-sigma factor [Pelagibius marinus]|uniref:anti-sigma factor n=1 Tax=Pelagibius marinus TaxID=2762760 RepID=UPI001872D632|nr:anti-sigma factor [Pelagibius marinus]
MADQDDKNLDTDLDAGERALGTEPRDGESAEERLARRDWDDKLAPLALAAPPAEPPAGLFERISQALDGEAEAAKVIRLAERRARRWRAVAIASSGIAAGLAAVVFAMIYIGPLGQVVPPAVPQQSYVALVTPEGEGGPALLVEVDFYGDDRQEGRITIQSVQVEAPAGRSLELWRVPAGGSPQSMGVIAPRDPFTPLETAVEAGDTLAVSVEPPGGSPSGAPTGPVILSGPLIETR